MTVPSPNQSIRVHSDPYEVWFSTEVEAITKGVLQTNDATTVTDREYLGSQMHAFVRFAVQVFAQRREPFTVCDIYGMVDHPDSPIPQGRTPADLKPLLRRLRLCVDPSSLDRPQTGGRT